ncbi:hypothetical protein SUGI_0270360 [Cryptomeria japonica]|nr:hypothetical protein SUGI_0270360 [Cryptomeria japonica]
MSTVEAKRLWNAFVKDAHNLLPKLAPQIFSRITLLQGDGGVGTIRQINFTMGNKNFRYVVERVEEMDEEKFVYCYSHVEGGVLGKKLASAKYEFKFRPEGDGGDGGDGGCICSCVFHYESLPGVQQDQGKVQQIKNMSTALFNKIEAYLLANPALYC